MTSAGTYLPGKRRVLRNLSLVIEIVETTGLRILSLWLWM